MKQRTPGRARVASIQRDLRSIIGLGTIFLLAGTLSAGQAAPGRSKALLFLQPNASAPAQLLTETESSVIQAYESQTLLSVASHRLTQLRALAEKLGLAVRVRDDFDTIRTSRGPLDARVGLGRSFPGHAAAKPYPSGTKGVHLLQYVGPVLPAWETSARSLGVESIQYLPHHAYICVGTPEAVAAARGLPFVQFADVMPAFLKPRIRSRAGELAHAVVQIAKAPGSNAVLADLERRSTTPLTVTQWSGLEIHARGTFDGGDVDEILDEPLVFGIARVPHLEFSDERAAISLTRHVQAGQPIRPPGGYKAWLAEVCPFCTQLQADGFWAGIADSGLAGGDTPDTSFDHPDMARARLKWGFNGLPPPNHYQDGPTPGNPPTDIPGQGHGTMVAGVLAGDPQSAGDAAGFLFGTGVAPSVGLLVSVADLRITSLTPIADLTANALEQVPAVRVQSHSYNEYVGNPISDNYVPCLDGTYSLMSRSFDRAVLDGDHTVPGNQPITLVVSSGNQSQTKCHALLLDPTLTTPPATAKNVVSAGMAENARPEPWTCSYGNAARHFDNIASDSKRGTRTPGWFKPDLFVPAAGITSARSPLLTSITNWSGFCQSAAEPGTLHLFSAGTSFAAPGVAGAAVLAQRVYAEHRALGCRQAGTCTSSQNAASPAMTKAMLILSATSMSRGTGYNFKGLGNEPQTISPIGPLPNDQQGFGRVHLEEMFSRYPAHTYVDENSVAGNPLQPGASWSGEFTVHDLSAPVKIALAWSDLPGLQDSEEGTSVAPLVNNLDLAVEVLDGVDCVHRFVGNDLVAGAEDELSAIHAPCTAGEDRFDSLNNVEIVRFTPTSTRFRVVVRFTEGSAQSQPFALALWNAFSGDSPPLAPPAVNAEATTTSAVSLTWGAVPGALSYEVARSAASGAWTKLTETSNTAFVDSGLPASTAFLYRVRSLRPTAASAWSLPDPAATVVLEGTFGLLQPVLAEHLFKLRRGATALALLAGMPAPIFTDPAEDAQSLTGVLVDASHILELRSYIQTARVLLGLSNPDFASTVSAGATISFTHFDEVWRAFK